MTFTLIVMKKADDDRGDSDMNDGDDKMTSRMTAMKMKLLTIVIVM